MTIFDRVATDHEVQLDILRTAADILTAPERRATAAAYLRQRGIDASALPPDWLLGYAPPGWTRLTDDFRHRGVPAQLLLATGLSRRASHGRLIDVFRDRVILPVRDHHDRIVGFTGRDLSGATDNPKYLNTPATALYRKSELLYGLTESTTHAHDAQIVLVEGPLDVLAIAAQDQDRTLRPVAACGTAVTNAHAHLIADYTARTGQPVVIAMDGDAAGRAAAAKAGELLRLTGADVRVALLPNGLDPAQHLAQPGNDLDVFRSANALPLLTIQVHRCIEAQGENMQWIEGRVAAARAIATHLTSYPPDHAVAQAVWIADALHMPLTTFAMILGTSFTDAHALPAGRTRAGELLRAGAEYARHDSAEPQLQHALELHAIGRPITGRQA